MNQAEHTVVDEAVEAHRRGYVPVPIRPGQKRPALSRWEALDFSTEEEVRETFDEAGASGLGLLLGEPSGGLIDVDLDHPRAIRVAREVLPHTEMQTGRASNRWSHSWYRAVETLPATRRYKLPSGETIVEVRSTGAQTVIPPSIHPDGEEYRWEGPRWGEPAEVHGSVIGARAATVALLVTLLEDWPQRGGRHDAYLALAGALLRTRDGVHPLWEQALEGLVATLAVLTDDEDGPEQRAKEVIGTTVRRLNKGHTAQGWPTLSRIIGEENSEAAKEITREIEFLLGFGSRASDAPEAPVVTGEVPEPEDAPEARTNPLDIPTGRSSSWDSVDLGPFIRGEYERPTPGLLHREDGLGLLYPGRINYLYSKRESGKSWVSMLVIREALRDGVSTLLVDCEDDPLTAVSRLMTLGATEAEIEEHLTYVRPEAPLSSMSRGGDVVVRQEDDDWKRVLDDYQPGIVVVDGMTILYALHGLDSNRSEETETIIRWLKGLTRNGRSTVVLIDHVTKSAARGADPIGSQHKMAMVQGAAYHVWNIDPIAPGKVGRVELLVGKDRQGTIRAQAEGDPAVAAEIEFTASQDGSVMTTRISVPKAGFVLGADEGSQHEQGRLETDVSKMVYLLGEQDDRRLSLTQLREGLQAGAGRIEKVAASTGGRVIEEEERGPRGARMFRLVSDEGESS